MRDSPWPLVFVHCLLFCQAELQWSCSQAEMNRGGQLRGCRLYPPLPPPPPPPPPPRGLVSLAPAAPAALWRPWWMELIVLGSTGSALTGFLLLTVLFCYKAMKRKPQQKEKSAASSSIRKISSAAV